MQEIKTRLELALGERERYWEDTGEGGETRTSPGTSERDWNQVLFYLSLFLSHLSLASLASFPLSLQLDLCPLVRNRNTSSVKFTCFQLRIEFLFSSFRETFQERLIGLASVSFPELCPMDEANYYYYYF